MIALLFAFLLAQISPAPTGVATGIVRSASGLPSAGVRVYAIPAGDSIEAADSPVVFESLAQTDAAGRFRLEVPTGRYYIAVGSVTSPTYYPDAAVISSAKQILITAGMTVDEINFSRYVVASQQAGIRVNVLQLPPPPGSTGILSGIVRTFDGRPASGVTVVAVPESTLRPDLSATFRITPAEALNRSNNLTATVANTLPASLMTMVRLVRGGMSAVTDNTGRFRIENLTQDSYYILAGTADSPTYYPGTPYITIARRIATTPTTKLDTINFRLASPPNATLIRGRVSGIHGEPASGTSVEMRFLDPPLTGATYLLPGRINKTITAGDDGSFEIAGVLPGSYSVVSRLAGAAPVTKSILVANQPLRLDITFPVNVLSARILWDNGSPVSLPVITEVAVSTASDPKLTATTIIQASLGGTFTVVLDSGEYRFFVRDIPQGYTIQSIRSGTTDLLRETLSIGPSRASDIEVRIAKATVTEGKVSGTVLDAASRRPQSGSRLRLCCFKSGPFERISTAIGPDGSFEFSGVPSGQYTAELEVSPPGRIVQPVVEVGNQGTSGVKLLSSAQMVPVTINISSTGDNFPEDLSFFVNLTSPSDTVNQGFRITTSGTVNAVSWASVPAGIPYTVTVSGLPSTFTVKSIVTGTTDLMVGPLSITAPPTSQTGNFNGALVPPIPIQITLAPRE